MSREWTYLHPHTPLTPNTAIRDAGNQRLSVAQEPSYFLRTETVPGLECRV